MAKDLILLKLHCFRCGSDQPHILGTPGAFYCIACRADGHNTMRIIMATCDLEVTKAPSPK